MSYDRNNIFAKILRGEIPCKKVYENDHDLAFHDINHQKKNPHEAVKIARKLNIKIVTDLEFLKILNIKNSLIGVTGTNG